jgi:hypothetical protein
MCKSPYIREDSVPVKCGQCKECLTQRAAQWAYRCIEESRHNKSALFITLTYRDEDVPTAVNKDTGEVFTTLVKKDVQDFLKRLRYHQKQLTNDKIRVLYTGEYGDQLGRGHYHAIVWNLHPSLTSWKPSKSKQPQKDFILAKVWKLGYVKTGRAEGGSIRYVTNYMLMKNIDVDDCQEKPFMKMSLKPPIGGKYVDTYRDRHLFHEDYKMYSNRPEEFRPNLPRVFQEKIFNDIQIKQINEEKAKEYTANYETRSKHAEQHDPLDPLGYMQNQDRLKERRREEFKKFINRKSI